VEGGAILNINEIDHVSEDASNILHALLDDFEVARLTLPNNETIVPEIGFRVIATMNGTPDDLNEAVLDRFGIILPVDSPSEEMLNLLQEDTRVACIKEYRSAVKVNSSPEITYRILHNFDKHRAKLGDLKAAQAVFPSKAGVQGFVEALVLNRRELAQ
jgi:MoxR-like ATPase